MSTMIKNLVTSNLAKAFDGALGDTVSPFLASRKGTGGYYDPELGDYVDGADVTYTGRGVFGSYNDFEIQANQIDINDVKLTCLQDEVGDKPKVDDTIIHNDTSHSIISIKQDPSGATWTIQLRGLANVG